MNYREQTIFLVFNPKTAVNFENEIYWQMVGEFLQLMVGDDLKLLRFEKNEEGRRIDYVGGNNSINITHSWRRDGTSSKPVTFVNFDIDGAGDVLRLGRFAIWSTGYDTCGPHTYAEDIWGVIANNM